jgi:hypothetical protein
MLGGAALEQSGVTGLPTMTTPLQAAGAALGQLAASGMGAA